LVRKIFRGKGARNGELMKKSRPQQGLTSEEASRATGVPPNNLRRHNNPEVAAKLRAGLPDPAKTLRYDLTTILPDLVAALERIAKELSLLRRQVKQTSAKATREIGDLPF
jgi:hypothetical protein